MASSRVPGFDAREVQTIVDGTLCRNPSSAPGLVVPVVGIPLPSGAAGASLLYCRFWSESDRRAFWKGFFDRAESFKEEIKGYFNWFLDAMGLGDADGDFGAAWKSFGSAILSLAELAYKAMVVAGLGPFGVFHPRRGEYASELKAMGLKLARNFWAAYEKAYDEGGMPQCMGLLLADLLRLAFEIALAKGATAAVAGIRSSGVLSKIRLPKTKPLPDSVPPKKTIRRPDRPIRPNDYERFKFTLIDDYLGGNYNRGKQPAGGGVKFGRGLLVDLKPGQYLVRVEARHTRGPGAWFNGPFKTLEEAREYSKALSDLGKREIRELSALPEMWQGGKAGNPVEVARIYSVQHRTPALHSVVAAQKEGKWWKILKRYSGDGAQLELPSPYGVKKDLNIDLVKDVEYIDIANP